ncbi:MAG TPA: rhodanese-like domain-containing protein [Catalimonadaceae bacterium]|nr:rhodanese-like domain-containing protein [Catalimonadaceae bacterium]
MFGLLKKLFSSAPDTDWKELMAGGAVILDVRSKGEFMSGHIAGAMNIPVDVLGSQLSRLPKGKAIITCCASGMRSSSAKSQLVSAGYTEVYNGGGWSSLQNKIR